MKKTMTLVTATVMAACMMASCGSTNEKATNIAAKIEKTDSKTDAGKAGTDESRIKTNASEKLSGGWTVPDESAIGKNPAAKAALEKALENSVGAVWNRSGAAVIMNDSSAVSESSDVSSAASQAPADSSEAPQSQPGDIAHVWDPKEYSSLSELSEAIGIRLNETGSLPFEVKDSNYAVMFGSFAEINYNGTKGENCCIRAGKDTEDISGDYNEYDTVKETDTAGTKVTVKGNSGRFCLATWIKDGHFFAVSLSEGVEEQVILNIVGDMVKD